MCNIIYRCSTLYKAYREKLYIREKNKDCWIKQAYNLLNLLNVDITAMNLSKTISECTLYFKQSFHAFWNKIVNIDERKGNCGNKLRTYRQFKQYLCEEKYVTLISSKPIRRNIPAVRRSAHKLNIEQLCYTSIQARMPPEQRLCSQCNLKET
jgi:hypothetical protein